MFALPAAAGMLSLWLPLAARAAAISGFSPSFGQPGNVVTVNGSGFNGATLVEINTFAPTPADFTVISDGELQFVVPLGAASGPLQVYIGSSPATSAASFLVAPVITNFTPTSGTSPTVVTIQGANFITNGTTVVFSGTNASVAGTVVALTEVVAAVPAGAANGPITVITSAGTNVSTNNFITSTAPTITGFSPVAAARGAAVVINGGNFFSPVTVKFNGTTASATVVSTTQLSATVPMSATSGPITVSTTNGAFTTSSNFLTGVGPIITDFAPTLGTSNTAVTIDGLNLASATSVTFSGKAATITADTASQLQVYPPVGSGIGTIKVTTAQGNFTTSTNFTNSATPLVTDFFPVLGPVGSTVTIDGLNFATGATVTFNGITAASSVVAPTQISATVPSTASTGPIKVTVGASSDTTSSNFTVTTAAPVITGFTPAGGVRGQSVILTGGNFTNLSNPAVRFNGVAATYQTPTSTTALTATVPAGASSGPVSVTSSGGTGTSAANFYLQPWITSLSSNAAIVNATLTITGRNFLNTGAVQVNGVNYNFSATATQITAAVPTNASTGLIRVTAPGGVIISTNAFAILPKIYSFTPTIGPAGTVVTISGTSLFDVTNVQFGGVNAPVFTAATNQLQVTVPAGGKIGPITVVTPYGNDVSSNNFTVTQPSLLVLTKTASPVISGPGTNVTYTLLVTNEGPSTVTGLLVTDTVPSTLSFVSAASSVGSCLYSNSQVVCDIGIFSNNASAAIQVVAAASAPGSAINTASMGFVEGNLAGYNNLAYAYTYFISAAQRTLSIALLTNPPELLITWPQSSVSFLLQRSTNLALTNGWQFPSEEPFVTNGLNSFTDSPAGSGAFYRLKSP
ncbi:MAG: IPT/TIG domain-containing protein [Verrucomicrobiota bacterium]